MIFSKRKLMREITGLINDNNKMLEGMIRLEISKYIIICKKNEASETYDEPSFAEQHERIKGMLGQLGLSRRD